MISMKAFAANVVALSKTITEYVWGATGENGKCDCVGLIIGALRMGNVKWTGTNGTNYTARNEMRYLTPLEDGSKLQLGQVVLKSRSPGQSGYALPEKYKSGSDLNDYYHIGTVTSIEPLEITHCTEPGPIKRDKSVSGWHWYGELSKVRHTEEGDQEIAVPMVVAGGKLALRNGPGKNYQVKIWIPDGEEVQVLPYDEEWARVTWGKYEGYSMQKYLRMPGEQGQDGLDMVTITIDRSTAETMLIAFEKGLK